MRIVGQRDVWKVAVSWAKRCKKVGNVWQCGFLELSLQENFDKPVPMDIFLRSNTQALRGIAALGILLFHVLLGLRLSPLVNMLGGLFVAVFLVLSGFGLEESYRQRGLGGFWPKRLEKVVLPTVFFVCAYNYLFSFLPLGWESARTGWGAFCL